MSGNYPAGVSDEDVGDDDEGGVTCAVCSHTYGELDWEAEDACPNCAASRALGEDENEPAPVAVRAPEVDVWRCYHCMRSSVLGDWLDNGFKCPRCRAEGDPNG